MGNNAMALMAGATTLGDLAVSIGVRSPAISDCAELKAGSEDAYAWLIAEFHQPIYSLVYRIVTDPADAADTTQEVFLKVFRGMKHFHGESSLKTWIYRIAVHEASNRRRWWFRHKAKETSIEPNLDNSGLSASGMRVRWSTKANRRRHGGARGSPGPSRRRVATNFGTLPHHGHLARSGRHVVRRDSRDHTGSLGTVKSRLTRGREALRRRLTGYVVEHAEQLGLRLRVRPKGGWEWRDLCD